jgi:hypothetical protein
MSGVYEYERLLREYGHASYTAGLLMEPGADYAAEARSALVGQLDAMREAAIHECASVLDSIWRRLDETPNAGAEARAIYDARNSVLALLLPHLDATP